MLATCPRCRTPNRSTARFCSRCGQPLAAAPAVPAQISVPSALQSWLGQVRQTLTLVWAQGAAEVRAFYDEWIARRPALSGTLTAPPQQTQVTIVMQGLFVLAPFSTGSSQQTGLLMQVRDANSGTTVDVLMIGAHRGTLPLPGDLVTVWGEWDAQMKAYRAWRVEVTERQGQPVNLQLTTGRPAPLALISLILIAFVLLSCICTTCVGIV